MKKFLKNKLREGFDKVKGEETESFHINIEDATIANDKYREVIYTTSQLQLVLMSLKPKEEIGEETHDYVTQFIRFEKGDGKVIMGETTITVTDGDSIIIPAGVKHNIINTSDKEDLKIYTIYSPPNHPKDTDEETKPKED